MVGRTEQAQTSAPPLFQVPTLRVASWINKALWLVRRLMCFSSSLLSPVPELRLVNPISQQSLQRSRGRILRGKGWVSFHDGTGRKVGDRGDPVGRKPAKGPGGGAAVRGGRTLFSSPFTHQSSLPHPALPRESQGPLYLWPIIQTGL